MHSRDPNPFVRISRIRTVISLCESQPVLACQDFTCNSLGLKILQKLFFVLKILRVREGGGGTA